MRKDKERKMYAQSVSAVCTCLSETVCSYLLYCRIALTCCRVLTCKWRQQVVRGGSAAPQVLFNSKNWLQMLHACNYAIVSLPVFTATCTSLWAVCRSAVAIDTLHSPCVVRANRCRMSFTYCVSLTMWRHEVIITTLQGGGSDG